MHEQSLRQVPGGACRSSPGSFSSGSLASRCPAHQGACKGEGPAVRGLLWGRLGRDRKT